MDGITINPARTRSMGERGIYEAGEETRMDEEQKKYSGKEGVYRWSESFGRMGALDGVFTAHADEVAGFIGKHVYFGEVLGKHSDVSCVLKAEQFELLTDDADFVDKFKQYRLWTGTDPIQEWRDAHGEDEEEEGEDE